MKQFVLTALAGLALSGLAMANITVIATPTVTPTAGDWTWTYDVTLGGDETATSTVPGGSCAGTQIPGCTGTFFTIYDFAGLVGTPIAPTGWSVETQDTGATPNGVTPFLPDDPTLTNLTFYYTGGTNIPGPDDFGNFVAVSMFGNGVRGDYTEQSNSDPTGTLEAGGGFTEVPTSTPEPITLPILGAAMIGLVALRHRFVRR